MLDTYKDSRGETVVLIGWRSSCSGASSPGLRKQTQVCISAILAQDQRDTDTSMLFGRSEAAVLSRDCGNRD